MAQNIDEELARSTAAQRAYQDANPTYSRGAGGPITEATGAIDYNTTAPDPTARAATIQRSIYDANPVVPRAPAGPMIADQSNAGGFGVQPGTDLNTPGRGIGGMISDAIDARAQARLAERGPVVDQSTSVVRPPSAPTAPAVKYGNEGRGNGAPNVPVQPNVGETRSVPIPGAGPVSQAAAGVDPYNAPRTVESMRRELDMRNAAEFKNLMESRAANNRLATTMTNDYQRDINIGNAMRTLSGQQNSILNRDKYGGLEKDYTPAIAALAMQKGMRTAPDDFKGTPIQDQIAVGEAVNKQGLSEDARTRVTNEKLLAASKIRGDANTAQIEEYKLKAAKRMDEIHSKLADPKLDPKEHQRLSQTLLAMMGKDKPEEFKVLPLELPDSVDPTTGAVLKGGKAAVVLNIATGAREIVRLDDLAKQAGGQKGAPPGKDYKPGATLRDASGKIIQLQKDGQWKAIDG